MALVLDDSLPTYYIEAKKSPDDTPIVLRVPMLQVFAAVQDLFRDHPGIMRVEVVSPKGKRVVHTREEIDREEQKIETPAAPDSTAPVAATHEVQADQPSEAAQTSEPVSLSKKVRKQLKKLTHGLGKRGDSAGKSAHQ